MVYSSNILDNIRAFHRKAVKKKHLFKQCVTKLWLWWSLHSRPQTQFGSLPTWLILGEENTSWKEMEGQARQGFSGHLDTEKKETCLDIFNNETLSPNNCNNSGRQTADNKNQCLSEIFYLRGSPTYQSHSEPTIV